jgi:hypothetical protein
MEKIYISGTGISRFIVEVANTDAERIQGLSDRPDLLPRNGLLFIFDSVGVQSMWMKNMNFPLDIVWIDANKKIVKIQENALPCSMNSTHICEAYSSIYPIKYAIELKAGDATAIGLRNNLQLRF